MVHDVKDNICQDKNNFIKIFGRLENFTHFGDIERWIVLGVHNLGYIGMSFLSHGVGSIRIKYSSGLHPCEREDTFMFQKLCTNIFIL